jgi:hypothetical protein
MAPGPQLAKGHTHRRDRLPANIVRVVFLRTCTTAMAVVSGVRAACSCYRNKWMGAHKIHRTHN